MAERPMTERLARRVAAAEMHLVEDPNGLRLPDNIWLQSLPIVRAVLAELENPSAAMVYVGMRHKAHDPEFTPQSMFGAMIWAAKEEY